MLAASRSKAPVQKLAAAAMRPYGGSPGAQLRPRASPPHARCNLSKDPMQKLAAATRPDLDLIDVVGLCRGALGVMWRLS